MKSVAVIGAGIIGLSIAWRLARKGHRVTIFEARTAAGEASWAGAGMLAPGGEADQDGWLAQMSVEARRLYPEFVSELEAESGLEIDFQQAGALDLAYSDTSLALLAERAERQASFGIPSKPLKPKSIQTFWPHLRTEGLAGARFYPEDALVNPRHITAALRKALEQRSIPIREQSPVRSVHLDSSSGAVETDAGSERFDAVIIAAGAWSQQIQIHAAPVLPSLPPVEPVHGILIGYQQPDQTCSTIVRNGHTYLLQRANGMLIVGASVERLGFSREIRADLVARLVEEAGKVFPHLSETTPTEVWTGLRPYSEPVHVTRWHSPHLLLAYGHYRNGILLAPHTAEQIVTLVEEDQVAKPSSLER